MLIKKNGRIKLTAQSTSAIAMAMSTAFWYLTKNVLKLQSVTIISDLIIPIQQEYFIVPASPGVNSMRFSPSCSRISRL